MEGNACLLIRGTVQEFIWKTWGNPRIDCVPGEDQYEPLPDSYDISCGLNMFKTHRVKFYKPLSSTIQVKEDNLIQAADGNTKHCAEWSGLLSNHSKVRFYLNINQLDALNFVMSLFHASTCFEHMCS